MVRHHLSIFALAASAVLVLIAGAVFATATLPRIVNERVAVELWPALVQPSTSQVARVAAACPTAEQIRAVASESASGLHPVVLPPGCFSVVKNDRVPALSNDDLAPVFGAGGLWSPKLILVRGDQSAAGSAEQRSAGGE